VGGRSPAEQQRGRVVTSAIADLIDKGYVKLGPVLTPEDVAVLREESGRLLAEPKIPYAEYQAHHKHDPTYRMRVYANRDWTVAVDVIGWSRRFDDLMGKVLTHPTVRETMAAVLGPDYKLWQLNIRRHEPGSLGQPLHQDAPGGLGLSLLVSDTPKVDGATAFLPRSHRWPVEYHDVGLTLRPAKLRRLLDGATGQAGDVSLFFNRTWHGRFPGDLPATAILASFFCVGSKYPIHEPPNAVLENVHPELARMLDARRGVRHLHGNEVVVVSDDGSSSKPPAIEDLRFAIGGSGPAPTLSPWRILRGLSRARHMAVRTLGKERLKLLRDAVRARRPDS